ncbi:MAG: FAD-binding oxidoreductase, partial [Pseudomonadota bacterium]
TQRYHGLLWGEHGKGVRSEYAPQFFGALYPSLQRVKAAFDPHNQLNPGKIATPGRPHADDRTSGAGRSEESLKLIDPGLLTVDGVPTRGQLDRTIDERAWQAHAATVYCNGNGACYNYAPND